MDSGYCEFDIAEKGKTIAHVNLNVPGEHEIYDALAAFAACSVYGIPPKVIAEGLSNYKGISRRMDKVCVTKKVQISMRTTLIIRQKYSLLSR